MRLCMGTGAGRSEVGLAGKPGETKWGKVTVEAYGMPGTRSDIRKRCAGAVVGKGRGGGALVPMVLSL